MTARVTLLVLIMACIPLRASEDAFNPFASIIKRGDVIVATLSKNHRWVVSEGRSGPMRQALDGESFRLAHGGWLWLAEAHPTRVIYRLRGRLSPLASGVQVEQRFAARTFGDMSVPKSYFLKAQ